MKKKLLLLASVAALAGGNAWAQITVTQGTTPDAVIPSDDLSGLASTITLNKTGISDITGVTLTLDVLGDPNVGDAFNGNYYAYLSHGSGISILLNRVGVTAVNSYGSSDSGFDITLSDGSYNIHDYQDTSYTLNANGQLTGAWGPDGRDVSPFTVTDTDTPNALLNAFNGQNANGGWTLFIADVSTLSQAELVNWSLSVTGPPAAPSVPDGGSALVMLGAGCVLLVCGRRFFRASPARGQRASISKICPS